MKKESKSKKPAKKAAPAPVKSVSKKAAPVTKETPKKAPAKKPAKKKKVAASKPNSTGAKIADLLKSTLVTQQTPVQIKEVETVPLSAAAPTPTPKPVESGAKLNAQNFRPAMQVGVKLVRPYTRFRAAGV